MTRLPRRPILALPLAAFLSLSLVLVSGCAAAPTAAPASPTPSAAPTGSAEPTRGPGPDPNKPTPGAQGGGEKYSLSQAMSDQAQLSTIAFSGLAFLTGSAGADSFFPPGKVADFFGFQYMRDVDVAGYGHNTTFLSKVANAVLSILSDAQKAQLVALAKVQAPIYERFALGRFPLMQAFRRDLEGDLPSGATGLDADAVAEYTALLYGCDADLSIGRAETVGAIVRSFTDAQKTALAAMAFDDSSTWPTVAEDEALKKSLTNTQFVAVMTYASELFSWYRGGLDADVYFCPERHGTYFGGFYMKDQPAMGNPDYFIPTTVTGDKGQAFLELLAADQRALIEGILPAQRAMLAEVAAIRTEVSAELRKAMTQAAFDEAKVRTLIARYGELDGAMSALYAERFSAVAKTLTSEQKAKLVALRDLDVVPQGAYEFSSPIALPSLAPADYLFGVGQVPGSLG